jgi:hypothetical protein
MEGGLFRRWLTVIMRLKLAVGIKRIPIGGQEEAQRRPT